GLLHLDLHSHPRMDTALKIVLTFRQARDLNMTALNDPGLGNINVFKTTSAFGSGFLTCVEGVDKAPAELLHFSKGVRLAALVNDRNNGPFFDFENIGLKVPASIGGARRRLCKHVLQRSCESKRTKGNVFAEIRPERSVKG